MNGVSKLALTVVTAMALHVSGAACAEGDSQPAQLSYQICANVRPIAEGLEVVRGTQVLPAMFLPAGSVILANTMTILDAGQPIEFVELIKTRCSLIIGQSGHRASQTG